MGNFISESQKPNQGPPQQVLKQNIKWLMIEGYIQSIALSKTVSNEVIQIICNYFKQYEDIGLKIGTKGKLVSSTNVWTQYSPETSEMRVSHSVNAHSTQFIVCDTYTIQYHDSNDILIPVILTKVYSPSFPYIATRFVQNKTKCYIQYESTSIYKQRNRDIELFKFIEQTKLNNNQSKGLLTVKITHYSNYFDTLYSDHRRLNKMKIDKDTWKQIDELIVIAPEILEIKTYSMVYVYIPKLDIYAWCSANSCKDLKIALHKERSKLNKNKYNLNLQNKSIYVYTVGEQLTLYSEPILHNQDLTGNTIYSYQNLWKLHLLSTHVKHGMICVEDVEKGRWGWHGVPVWINLHSVKYDDTIKYYDKRKVKHVFMYEYLNERKNDTIIKGTEGMVIKSNTIGFVDFNEPIVRYDTYRKYSKYNRFEVMSNGCVEGRADKNYYVKIRLISNEYNSNVDFEALQTETWIPLHCTNLYQRNEYLMDCLKMIKEFELILQNESDIENYLKSHNYTKSYVHGVTLLNANYYRSNITRDVQYTAILNSREEMYVIAPKNIDDIGFADTFCVYSVKNNALGWVECNSTGLKRYSNVSGDVIGIMPRAPAFASVDPLIALMTYVTHYANVISLNEQMTYKSITYSKVQAEAIESPMYKEWFWIRAI